MTIKTTQSKREKELTEMKRASVSCGTMLSSIIYKRWSRTLTKMYKPSDSEAQ